MNRPLLAPSLVTRAGHDAATARLTRLNSEIERVQAEISTGRRVRLPSDDPVSAARAASLRRAQAADAATRRGFEAASRRLAQTDLALASISTMAERARELGLAGANATTSATDRAILASEVRDLASAITALANSRDPDGLPLFGSAAPPPAFAAPPDETVPVWQGIGEPPAVLVAGVPVATALSGPQAFGEDPSLLATLDALATALTDPTLELPLADLEAALDRLADARALAGTRAARIERESDRLQAQSLLDSIDLSRLQDTDMIEAIPRLQRLLTVLEAAQASFARTASQSLWDVLR